VQVVDIPGINVGTQEYFPYVSFTIDLNRLYATS
jgi:hypothetical protein